MTMLAEIRDRLPVQEVTVPAPNTAGRIENWRDIQEDQRRTLRIFLTTLNNWVQGQKDNHEALDHRENPGYECWRSFSYADIRNMVGDTARELGLGDVLELER